MAKHNRNRNRNANPATPAEIAGLQEAIAAGVVEIDAAEEARLAAEAAAAEEMADEAELDELEQRKRSVVKVQYKQKYRAKAREAGIKGKAAKRSAWDWLAQQMAELVLVGKSKLDVEAFEALMKANDIDTSRWTNRSNGWEGRLRMTGGLALRRKLADTGVLKLADGSERELPESEKERLRAKYDL